MKILVLYGQYATHHNFPTSFPRQIVSLNVQQVVQVCNPKHQSNVHTFVNCFLLRYFFLKTKEQVSMKNRNYSYKSPENLKYGNNGFFFKKPLRFEFSYFNIIKKLVKIFTRSKYTLCKFFSF